MTSLQLIIILSLVLVLCLYLTDIPFTFIKFFAQLLNPQNSPDNGDEVKLWSSTPTKSFKVPVWGYFKSKRIRAKLLRYNKALIKNRIQGVSWLYDKVPEFKNNSGGEKIYRNFSSRKENVIPKSRFAVVTGMPGTGKTTFVLNHIQNNLSNDKLNLIIYFPYSYLKQKNIVSPDADPEDTGVLIWRGIFKMLSDNGVYNHFRPDPSTISYLLNFCSTTIFIDDVIGSDNVRCITELFHTYQQQYHRRKSRLTVILTTREESAGFSSENVSPSIIRINPLLKQDTESFFEQKCNELKIERNLDFYELVSPKDSVLRFEDKFTQNPLFVELVTYMILKGDNKDLRKVFQKSIPAVYRHFIAILFGRNEDKSLYNNFYTEYKTLAFHAWRTQSLDFDDSFVRRFINAEKYNPEFLNSRGLLKGEVLSGRTRYQFIHKTICDILFVEHSVDVNDYSGFSGAKKIEKAYEYYLSEQVQSAWQLTDLSIANPDVALDLCNETFLQTVLKNEGQAKIVFDGLYDHYVIRNAVLDSAETAVFLLKRISRRIGNAEHYTKQKIAELNTVTEKTIHFAALFGFPAVNDYLITLLVSGKNERDFAALLNSRVVAVTEMIDKYITPHYINSDKQIKLFSFLLSSQLENTMREKYANWFLEQIAKFSEESLTFLLKRHYILETVLFPKYTFTNLAEIKRINKILLSIEGLTVFIPKGTYSFAGKNLINPSGLKVPKIAKEILVIAKNNYEAEMDALNRVTASLLTFDQLQIMYIYFSKSWAGDMGGVVTLHDDSIKARGVLYEAYKDNNYGRLYFANRSGHGINQIVLQSRDTPKGKTKFVENIMYRVAERY